MYGLDDKTPEQQPIEADRQRVAVVVPAAAAPRVPNGAGNSALARLIGEARLQRAPPDPARVVAAEDADFATLEAKSLNDLHAYARRQADWHMQPNMLADAPRADKLRDLLRIAEEGGRSAPFMAACGEFSVSDLLAGLATADGKAELQAYSDAHTGFSNVAVGVADTYARARSWGNALKKLEKAPGAAIAQLAIKQSNEGHQLQDLIDAKAVDDFVRYCDLVKPVLSATNGADIDSYLLMRLVVDPASYHGSIPHARNYHHFTKKGLDALQSAWADTGKSKPLTLVLHTPIDHNGAFHHDPHLEEVLTFDKSKRLTLLVEGSSLGELSGLVPTLAKTYGQGDKISQVMLAGHGEWNVMDLAGSQDPDGTVHEESLRTDPKGKDQKKEADDTKALFGALLDNMDTSPGSRILLNGCLLNSHDASGDLSKNPAEAKKQLQKAAATSNLYEVLEKMTKDRGMSPDTVMGANASFTSAATLIDPASGQLSLADPSDPALTSPDKFEYVRKGVEPEGVMRAVLEKWVIDRPATEKAMRDHLPPVTGYVKELRERVSQALLEVGLATGDVRVMNTLSHAARGLGELTSPENWDVGWLLAVPLVGRDTIFAGIASTDAFAGSAEIQLLVHEAWALTKPAEDAAFLDRLGSFTCDQANRLVDLEALKPILGRLIGAAAAHPAGALRLALLSANRDSTTAPAVVKTYLRGIRGPTPSFADPVPIRAALGGFGTVDDIEFAIDDSKPSSSGSSSGATARPNYNVDLDGDGNNDFFVEELTQLGAVTASKLNVREKPGMGEAVKEIIDKDVEVTIIGRSGSWYAIERAGKTRFVHTSWVRLT